VRRACSDHDALQPFLLDVFLDQLLTEGRAHELVVAGDDDAFEILASPARQSLDVDLAGDVAATVADVNSNLLGHRVPPFIACKARKEPTGLTSASREARQAERATIAAADR